MRERERERERVLYVETHQLPYIGVFIIHQRQDTSSSVCEREGESEYVGVYGCVEGLRMYLRVLRQVHNVVPTNC